MNPADLNCELKGACFMSYRTEMRNDQPQILTRRRAVALFMAHVLLAVPSSSAAAGEGALKLTAGT
ncbi:MAG: hypothetical protein VXW11_02865, partial [Pseudomonadota bacterium]|nr:hypothetical protein [Pseudomonadota bacterium]